MAKHCDKYNILGVKVCLSDSDKRAIAAIGLVIAAVAAGKYLIGNLFVKGDTEEEKKENTKKAAEAVKNAVEEETGSEKEGQKWYEYFIDRVTKAGYKVADAALAYWVARAVQVQPEEVPDNVRHEATGGGGNGSRGTQGTSQAGMFGLPGNPMLWLFGGMMLLTTIILATRRD